MNLKWPPPSFLWQPTKRPQLINIFERMTKRDKDKDMANTKTKTTKNNIGLHCCWPFLYAYISNPNNGTTTNDNEEDDTYNGAPIVLAMAEPLGRRWFFAWTVPTHQHHQHICRRFTGSFSNCQIYLWILIRNSYPIFVNFDTPLCYLCL